MSDTSTEVAADLDGEPVEEVETVDEEAIDTEDDQSEGEDEADLLNIEEVADRKVRIRVDGEEMVVPLSEAIAGYQRQADYTRKTQSLAQQRNELQWAAALKGALETNPQGTIQLLAEQFGAAPSAPARQAAQPLDEFLFEDTSVDPRYREIEHRLRVFEEERAQQHLERTIAHLSTKYGEEFDAREVVAAALAAGSTDLEATFKQIKFDKVMEEAKAAKAAAASKAKKVAAKKEAAVVSGGSVPKAGNVDSGAVLSIADAWREAKRQLGG